MGRVVARIANASLQLWAHPAHSIARCHGYPQADLRGSLHGLKPITECLIEALSWKFVITAVDIRISFA